MSRFKLTVLGFLGFIVMFSVFRVGIAQATENDQFRWDLISVNFATGTVSAGGHDSAKANDGSEIALTARGPSSRIPVTRNLLQVAGTGKPSIP